MDLLSYMINRDVKSYIDKDVIITHHEEQNPESIHLSVDEIVYIQKIKVETTEVFSLSYYSAIESKKISGKKSLENNAISRHIGNITFQKEMTGDFTITYVKLKIIK